MCDTNCLKYARVPIVMCVRMLEHTDVATSDVGCCSRMVSEVAVFWCFVANREAYGFVDVDHGGWM